MESCIYEGHSHSFDVGIARKLGMGAAAVFNHIVYWLRINAAKGHNIHDGKVWMYETQKEIADFLEYMTLEEVKKSIVKLLDSGLLIKGNYNKNPFDKTAWYTTRDQMVFIIKKTLTKAPYGAIDNAEGRHPLRPMAPCIIQEEHQEEHQEQQQSSTASAAVLVKNSEEVKTKSLPICEALKSVEIPIEEKIQITKTYPSEVIADALGWAMHPDNPPSKCLAASIKYGCKMNLSTKEFERKQKETPYQKVSKFFKHGEIYNGAECVLNSDLIYFMRGMKNDEPVRFDKFFTWEKLQALCASFGIQLPKSST